MRLFLFLILFCFTSLSLAELNSSDQTVLDIDSASQSVWKIHDKNFEKSGTGFFIGPNQFITNFHVIEGLLEDFEIEDLVLSYNEFPSLKIEKVLALSALYDLALLEIKAEESPPPLSLRENLSNLNKDLVIPGYPEGKWKWMNKIGEFLPQTLKQTSEFLVDHSDLPGASGSPVLDNKGQVVGVVYQSINNMLIIINLSPLKRFVSRQEGQNCKYLDIQECIRETLDNLRELAEQGDALAQYEQGRLYSYYMDLGRKLGFDLGQFKEKVFKWFLKSAQQGYAPAQENLAFYFESEEQDWDQALYWMEKAAEQGLVSSQYKLGLMYLTGEKQNFNEARKWIEKSAQQGYAPAQGWNLFNMRLEYFFEYVF